MSQKIEGQQSSGEQPPKPIEKEEVWHEARCPKTGRPYWWSSKTRVSTWTRPSGQKKLIPYVPRSAQSWKTASNTSNKHQVKRSIKSQNTYLDDGLQGLDLELAFDDDDDLRAASSKRMKKESYADDDQDGNGDLDDWGLSFDDGQEDDLLLSSAKKKGPSDPQLMGTMKSLDIPPPTEPIPEPEIGGESVLEKLIKAARAADSEDGSTGYDSTADVSDEDKAALLKPLAAYLRGKYSPMPYQWAWLKFFYMHPDTGGVFADDMGLGKTFSVWLAVISICPPGGQKKALLVANNQSVMNQWLDELNKFFHNIPSEYSMIWSGEDRWNSKANQDFVHAQVVLTTKDTLVSDFQWHSNYWVTDNSMNKTKSSVVMYAPEDGEPKQGANDGKNDLLVKRRRDSQKRNRDSLLYLKKRNEGLFSLVFVDEGDLVRAETPHATPGQIRKRSWQAVWHLFCPQTWIMTGTPVNNNATGLLSLFEVARCDRYLPERVRELKASDRSRDLTFMEKVRRLSLGSPEKATIEAVKTLSRSCCLRRTIDSDVIRKQNADGCRPLPTCKYVDIPVTVGDNEDIYMSTVETNTTQALRTWLHLDSGERYDAWSNVWSGMTQARRVAALNPRMGLQPSGTADYADFRAYPLSEKEKVIIKICRDAVSRNEQVVVATLFVECNIRLVEALSQFNIAAARFDGQVPQAKRQEGVTQFREKYIDVLVMLMFAGGRGLNLQNANHLIMTSPWWNPVVLDQARRRVWRVGSRHKVVTIYNVFYDISVEQWMLQTRVKSKVELASALMNEESMYGGEEAVTTAGSKSTLSHTLENKRLDEMWDFLTFLRAAPTARQEIRSVEDVPWSMNTMTHPLLGPRCLRFILSILLCANRTVSKKTLGKLPESVWIHIFSFLLGQDFPPVPEQGIAAGMEVADADERLLQQSQTQLQDIAGHITTTDAYLNAMRRRKDQLGGTLPEKEQAMETQVRQKQAELYHARVELEKTVSAVRQQITQRQKLARAQRKREEESRKRRLARKTLISSANTKNDVDLDKIIKRANKERNIQLADLNDDDSVHSDDGEVRFVDEVSENESLLDSDDDEMLREKVGDGEDFSALDEEFRNTIYDAVIKYLNRKPMTTGELSDKLKTVFASAGEKQKLAKSYLNELLDDVGTVTIMGSVPRWHLKSDSKSTSQLPRRPSSRNETANSGTTDLDAFMSMDGIDTWD
eukprot:m.28724 g.28724  ORF g.28724 m.28724 type:complete len:1207 (+) comp8029_c0_seq1:268-3888(+)